MVEVVSLKSSGNVARDANGTVYCLCVLRRGTPRMFDLIGNGIHLFANELLRNIKLRRDLLIPVL